MRRRRLRQSRKIIPPFEQRNDAALRILVGDATNQFRQVGEIRVRELKITQRIIRP
jgi:hypothetical protein